MEFLAGFIVCAILWAVQSDRETRKAIQMSEFNRSMRLKRYLPEAAVEGGGPHGDD